MVGSARCEDKNDDVQSSLCQISADARPSRNLSLCRPARDASQIAKERETPMPPGEYWTEDNMGASRLLEQHHYKNIALILLSLVFLPIDTFVVGCLMLSALVVGYPAQRRRRAARQAAGFQQRTVLVTGVGMSKGLALARQFWEAGHRVIGADGNHLACGRVSRSLTRYYSLRRPNAKSGSAPYVDDLLYVIGKEKVDLWCSCSSVASAVEDAEAKEIIEARTSCKAIQFDIPTTQKLHEKHSFIENTEAIGLTVPETHTITSLDDVKEALRKAPWDRTYIMKPIGMDDLNRGDMTLLPKNTQKATDAYLSKLKISKESPWILQQYIKGPEYCTHALVIKGQVKMFTSCRSAELLMHYVALPFESKLNQAMLRFTKRYATKEGKEFTGHLSFDFMIEEFQMDGSDSIAANTEVVLYPIECNPRAHTAVVLFNDTPGVADAYLSLLGKPQGRNGLANGVSRAIIIPQENYHYYWIGHDLIELVIVPILKFLAGTQEVSFLQVTGKVATFILHVIFWRDGTFERWDATTWWWLYHVYWPMQFLKSLGTGKRWSRINVSTTKMFAAA